MRARNIKPGFFNNDQLPECAPLARILFVGLWCLADRRGRLEYRPKKIKIEILPCDDCDVEALLHQLCEHRFIAKYEVDDHPYIQVINFEKHQHPHNKEAESILPPPPLDVFPNSSIPPNSRKRSVPAPKQSDVAPSDSLIPDSLIPESSHSDDAHEREQLSSQSPVKASQRTRLPYDALPLDWLQWAQTDRGWSSEATTDVWIGFQDYWQEKSGKTARKSDWFSTWRVWCRNQKISKQGSYVKSTQNSQRYGSANKTERAQAAIIESAINHGYGTSKG